VKVNRFRHQFVEYVPDQIEKGILYISTEFATASHACACGCGREVVTPISPIGWQFRCDGQGVSLTPSIGNWNYPCRSHYWIEGGRVRWDADMPQWAVQEGRERDRQATKRYYAARAQAAQVAEEAPQLPPVTLQPNATPARSGLGALLSALWRKCRKKLLG